MRLFISTLCMVVHEYITIWRIRYCQYKIERLINKLGGKSNG